MAINLRPIFLITEYIDIYTIYIRYIYYIYIIFQSRRGFHLVVYTTHRPWIFAACCRKQRIYNILIQYFFFHAGFWLVSNVPRYWLWPGVKNDRLASSYIGLCMINVTRSTRKGPCNNAQDNPLLGCDLRTNREEVVVRGGETRRFFFFVHPMTFFFFLLLRDPVCPWHQFGNILYIDLSGAVNKNKKCNQLVLQSAIGIQW